MLPMSGLWFEIVSRNATTSQILEFLHGCLISDHFESLGDLDQNSFSCLFRLVNDSLEIRFPDEMLYSFLQHEIFKYGFMKNEK